MMIAITQNQFLIASTVKRNRSTFFNNSAESSGNEKIRLLCPTAVGNSNATYLFGAFCIRCSIERASYT